MPLERLLAGNERYVATSFAKPPERQTPFAAVLACADSRVPMEAVFDCKPGEIFVVRVAGNTTDDAVLGSLEYAVSVLDVPLIVVLGHTGCGAVAAAVQYRNEGIELPGFMRTLIEKVAPGVDENVYQTIDRLPLQSRILARAIEDGALQLAGAVYDLQSGEVTVVSRNGGE